MCAKWIKLLICEDPCIIKDTFEFMCILYTLGPDFLLACELLTLYTTCSPRHLSEPKPRAFPGKSKQSVSCLWQRSVFTIGVYQNKHKSIFPKLWNGLILSLSCPGFFSGSCLWLLRNPLFVSWHLIDPCGGSALLHVAVIAVWEGLPDQCHKISARSFSRWKSTDLVQSIQA